MILPLFFEDLPKTCKFVKYTNYKINTKMKNEKTFTAHDCVGSLQPFIEGG